MNVFKGKNQIVIANIIIGITFYWAIHNLEIIYSTLKFITSILAPVITGIILTLILGVFVKMFEKTIFKERKNKIYNKNRRLISVLVSYIVFIGVISLILVVIIPKVFESVSELSRTMPTIIRNLEKNLTEAINNNDMLKRWVETSNIRIDNLLNSALSFLQTSLPSALSTTISFTTNILKVSFTFFLGFIFSFYFLMRREKIVSFIERFFYAFFSEKNADRITYLLNITEDAFSNFFTGQFLDALSVGFLSYFVMTIFGIPQAVIIAFIIGVSALIPLFGTYIGPTFGILVLAISAPGKILLFIPLIIATVQFDINFIYPRLVGSRLGTPPILILIVISVAGALFGLLGLFFAVPLTSVIYSILRRMIDSRLKEKRNDKTQITV